MGTRYNSFFPRHEAPRLSAPIAVTSDVKWQDKSYQRDKTKLTQMLLIEMKWSQLLSSFPFIFSILHKNTTLTAPIVAALVFKDRNFYLSKAKVVRNSDKLRHSAKEHIKIIWLYQVRGNTNLSNCFSCHHISRNAPTQTCIDFSILLYNIYCFSI